VAAYFHFGRPRRVQVDGETFEFKAGEAIRLFFSYRHTPERVRVLLAQQGVEVLEVDYEVGGRRGVSLPIADAGVNRPKTGF